MDTECPSGGENKMKKGFLVFIGILVVIAVGAGVLWWQYTQSEGYLAEKFTKELMEQYENDTVGGSTPEETLQLFINALKAGDTDLAAQYFVIDEQEQWKIDLARIKDRDLLSAMAEDLGNLELSKKEKDEAFYVLVDETNLVVVQIVITKNPLNNIWKITEL